jgi:thiol-disulfide isomerase/thioredoxin
MKKLILIAAITCSALFSNAQYSNTKIQVGQKAPELHLKNPAGDTLSLSEINEKRIILIDFWASWCGPCRASSPALAKLYKDYSGKKFKGAKKGFTVVSVSLDKDKAAWENAIKADHLDWPYHLSDLGFWGSEAAKIYGTNYIPQCFLVDADGIVLGKYNHIEEAEKDLKKLLKTKKK